MLKEIKADNGSYRILIEWKKADPEKWGELQKVAENIEDFINDEQKSDTKITWWNNDDGDIIFYHPVIKKGQLPGKGAFIQAEKDNIKLHIYGKTFEHRTSVDDCKQIIELLIKSNKEIYLQKEGE